MTRDASQVRRFARLGAVVAAAAAFAVACGDDDPMGGDGVVSVTVSPSQTSVAVGGDTQFSASAQDAQGNEVTTSFSWSSSDQSVATVDGQGVATGQAEGTAFIVAAAEGVRDSAELTVTSSSNSAASVQRVSGNGQNGVTNREYDDPLVVEARDQNGDPVSNVPVSWSVTSGDAELSATSTTTGSDGRTQVRVTAGTATGPIQVEASAQGASSPATFDALDTTVALVMVGNNFFEDPGGNRNQQASVSIAMGDTVRWEWAGGVPHTVTANSSPDGGQSFDSGQQSSGSFTFIPQTTGTWEYFCEVHPNTMLGAEIVVSN